MNPTLAQLKEDGRRDISSRLIRIGCGKPAPDTWQRWREEAGVKKNAQLLTRWEAILLICRSQWKVIRHDMGLDLTSPGDSIDLVTYGIPWFEQNGRHLGEVFGMVLEPPTDEHDPFWGVKGSDLPAAIRAVSGKAWSVSTIRRCCLSLGWELKRSSRYSYAQVLKLSQ